LVPETGFGKTQGVGKSPLNWKVLEKMDQPEGPPNKKGRKFGHGTTSQARNERRKGMQWSALEKADPTDPTVLAKHLEALEKAKARCQERMADAVTKKLEQLSTSDEPRAGGAKHRGKSGQPRKAVLTPAAASSSSGLEKPTATLEKEGKKRRASLPRTWKSPSPRIWKSPRAAPPMAVPPRAWKRIQ